MWLQTQLRRFVIIASPMVVVTMAAISGCRDTMTGNRAPDDAAMTPPSDSSPMTNDGPRFVPLNDKGQQIRLAPRYTTTGEPDFTALMRRTDSLLEHYRPRDPTSRHLKEFAAAVRSASDSITLVTLARAAGAGMTRNDSSRSGSTIGSGSAFVSFRLRGQPFLRFEYPEARTAESRDSGVNQGAPSVGCDAFPADTPEDDLPAECVEGYDPDWDPTPLENDLAALYSETLGSDGAGSDAASLSRRMATLASWPNAADAHIEFPRSGVVVPRTGFAARFNDDCAEERALYYTALTAAAYYGGLTVWYIARRSPFRAWKSFEKTAASFGAVAIANAKLKECENAEDPQ